MGSILSLEVPKKRRILGRSTYVLSISATSPSNSLFGATQHSDTFPDRMDGDRFEKDVDDAAITMGSKQILNQFDDPVW